MLDGLKNIYNVDIAPYDWQEDVKNHINSNVCIIAPTGAGKTIAAYNWAFSDIENYHRVIFTAPIKALSNERYLELKKSYGRSAVGILTGDVKINPKAKILCVTQEIYTNHLAVIPHQKVIIDEVHYMFQDQNRSRAYVDGIYKTNKNSKLMLLSATINRSVVDYFSKVAKRPFVSIYVNERPIPLYFSGQASYRKIFEMSPAIVFVFSMRGVETLAKEFFWESKYNLDKEKLDELNYYAEKYRVSSNILGFAKRGIGMYSGSMLYKEKIFVEKLFRKGIIKVVVGTDALALGVNFPAKTVVFGQLSKYYDGPISKREFLQMAGRAGRPNLHDAGYAMWMNTAFESNFDSTGKLYNILLSKPLEKETLLIQPDYKSIFNKIQFNKLNDKKAVSRVVKKEIKFIKDFLLIDFEPKKYLKQIKKQIEKSIVSVSQWIKTEEDYQLFKDIYFSEFNIEINLFATKSFIENGYVDAIDFYNRHATGDSQRDMLQFLRFYKNISPKKYKVKDLNKFVQKIKEMDEFVLDPDAITD